MVHSFHEALRATFHELSGNYNPRGSIVYVLTHQRSVVIVPRNDKISLPAFLRNTKFIHVGELDAIEISETVANVLKKGFFIPTYHTFLSLVLLPLVSPRYLAIRRCSSLRKEML